LNNLVRLVFTWLLS